MARAFAFIANGMLSYRVHDPRTTHTLSFGTTFNPDYLWRKVSR